MTNFLLLLILLLGLFACIIEIYFLVTFVRSKFGTYPPFFLSFGKMKKTCLMEAKEILQKANKPLNIVDLGCGSGSLIIPLAKEFPQHNFYGYDWDVVPYFIASFRTKKLKNVQILKKDFTKVDISQADVVMIFAGNELFAKWGNEFVSKLKNNAWVISEAFAIKQLDNVKEISTPSYGIPIKVFVYHIDKNALANQQKTS